MNKLNALACTYNTVSVVDDLLTLLMVMTNCDDGEQLTLLTKMALLERTITPKTDTGK